MTDKDRKELRQYLLNLVSELEAQAMDGRLENCADVGDYAAQLVRHNLDVAVGERRLAMRREALAALSRLDSPDFGFCMECGEGIPAKRLKAQPTARYCVACQEEHDRRLGNCA